MLYPLTSTGIDYDPDYVTTCEKVLKEHKLEKLCSVTHASVYDFAESGFDAAYFSGKQLRSTPHN